MTRCKLLKKISCYWFSSFLSSHDSCRWPFIFSLESNHLISVIFRWNLELLVDGRALVMDYISTQKPGFCALEVLWRNIDLRFQFALEPYFNFQFTGTTRRYLPDPTLDVLTAAVAAVCPNSFGGQTTCLKGKEINSFIIIISCFFFWKL